MKIKNSLIALMLAFVLSLGLTGCVIKVPEPQEISSNDEAEVMGFKSEGYERTLKVGEYLKLDIDIKIDYEYELWWSTSDDKIAVVDSNGRVDGLKPGKVRITAHAKKAYINFDLEVVKSSAKKLSYTTANTANIESLENNKSATNNLKLYALLVNTANSSVTAYTYNANGIYNVPVRSMVCSVGDTVAKGTDTRINSDKEQWYGSDSRYYRYATFFGENLMFCSTPYSDMASSTLIASEYNKLGEAHKGGRIWLSVADAKWIYDNCDEDTQVMIKTNKPLRADLQIPSAISIPSDAPSKKWDPTDTHSENPYNKLGPVINGVEDITIKAGDNLSLYSGISACDTCNNRTDKDIDVDGVVKTDIAGVYRLSYYYTDALGRTARADRVVTVVEE